MSFLTLITPPDAPTDIANAMVLTVAETIEDAYAQIVDYRDGGGVPNVLWQAVILDDMMQIVSRLMAGAGPDVTRALARAWGWSVSDLRVHVFVGASSVVDDQVVALESITAAELIGEGDDLPQEDEPVDNSVDDPVDNSVDEEFLPGPVEETEEQP